MVSRFPMKGTLLFTTAALVLFAGGRGSLAKFTDSRFAERLKPAKIDLHSHSYCSDGKKTPEVLVNMAKEKGLKYLALTDHDTVACLPRAIQAGNDLGVQIIPGIEVSVEDDSIHMLALGINPENPELLNLLAENRAARVRRAKNIVELLRTRGLNIRWKEDVLFSKLNRQYAEEGKLPIALEALEQESEEQILQDRILGSITRPDIATVLVDKRIVRSRDEAFKLYLGDDALGDSGTFVGPTFSRAIDVIHSAGGVAILAHPHTIHKFRMKEGSAVYSGKTYTNFEGVARDLLDAGLDGFESYRARWEYFTRDINWIQGIARDHARRSGRHMYFTLGSDYHGYEKMGAPELGSIPVEPSAERDLFSLAHELVIK